MENDQETKSPCGPIECECGKYNETGTCLTSGVADIKDLPPMPEPPKETVKYEAPSYWTWDGWIEGPKWARIPEALQKAAWQWRLKLESTTTSRWFTELVFFKVGTYVKEDILAFKEWVNGIEREWNKND